MISAATLSVYINRSMILTWANKIHGHIQNRLDHLEFSLQCIYSWHPMLRPIRKVKKSKNLFSVNSQNLLYTIVCDSTVPWAHDLYEITQNILMCTIIQM